MITLLEVNLVQDIAGNKKSGAEAPHGLWQMNRLLRCDSVNSFSTFSSASSVYLYSPLGPVEGEHGWVSLNKCFFTQ